MPPRTPPPDRARTPGAARSARLDARARSAGGRHNHKAAAPGGGSRPAAADDARFRSRGERNFELPRGIVEELRASAEEAPPRYRRAPVTLERRLANAALAYERDRYRDALSALRPVLDAAPEAASVRELHGLILYRLGRWRAAAKELMLFHELTGSYDQHPVIADCERALGRPERVHELWDEIRRAGVDRDVLVEGRLVMAGTLADEDRLEEAIDLLRPEAKQRRNPDLAHLREWYALADLYERVGDLSRARELFARVSRAAPDLLDAPERLAALR